MSSILNTSSLNELNPERISYWKPIIKAWKNSGQSRFKFCELQGINFERFVYWRSKLPKGELDVKLDYFRPALILADQIRKDNLDEFKNYLQKYQPDAIDLSAMSFPRKAMFSVIDSIKMNCSNVSMLNISNNPLNQAGPAILRRLKHLPKLTALRVYSTGLRDADADAIANIFTDGFVRLVILNISSNPLAEGASTVLHGLKHLPKLEELRALRIGLCATDVADTVAAFTDGYATLSKLNISDNPINKAAPAVLSALKKLPMLEELHTYRIGFRQ